jgi:chromosome segregation ATPase
MFSSLKNKIKEETGQELPAPVRHPSIASTSRCYSRNRESVSSQHSAEDTTLLESKDVEISNLKSQLSESQNKLEEASKRLQKLEEEKSSLEKANSLLEESLKVAQGEFISLQLKIICF